MGAEGIPLPASSSPHVVIVGAGPAGAVLAHLLATRGIRVTLLERQTDFAREFRGEVLMPSGSMALASLGIDDALAKVPQSFPRSFEIFVNRRRTARVEGSTDSLRTTQPQVVCQPALLEAIIDRTQKSSHLRFERGASVKELTHENGRISGLRVRLPSGEESIRADLVIGCDGRGSIVRREAHLEIESEELPMDVVWCKLAAPPLWGGEHRARFCVGQGHLFICYIAYDGLLQTAWVIPKGGYGDLRRHGVDEWIEEIAKLVPSDLSDHFREHKDALIHPFLLSTAADRVRTWSVPGALVLGDAAHTMSPVGAQGINIALRDAIVAANHLVPVLRANGPAESIAAASRRIEEERVPEIRRIQRLQAAGPRVMLSNSRAATLVPQLSRLLGLAPAQILAARVARPFLFGTADVTLRV